MEFIKENPATMLFLSILILMLASLLPTIFSCIVLWFQIQFYCWRAGNEMMIKRIHWRDVLGENESLNAKIADLESLCAGAIRHIEIGEEIEMPDERYSIRFREKLSKIIRGE